jgi:hypothetical protein
MSDPANPATVAQSIGSEIVADGEAFIQSVETTLAADAEAAWSWLKAELAALEPTVLADLKAAVTVAATEALSTGSSGSIVTDTLNILARDGQAVLAKVKSDVITATVGLTTATPSKP